VVHPGIILETEQKSVHHFNDDTICVIFNSPGQGGIAVIRVSRPDTFKITEEMFQPKTAGRPLSNADGYTIHFGNIKDGESLIDEVFVSLFRRPNSYTGEDIVEISCHCSTYIQEQFIRLLQ
jgi:tRNA modification GTPase